jgi:hypothetical protein
MHFVIQHNENENEQILLDDDFQQVIQDHPNIFLMYKLLHHQIQNYIYLNYLLFVRVHQKIYNILLKIHVQFEEEF